ncbi:MAG: hypothetical protein KA314_23835 [Chloroflexi bacterium]|nr:hypothetical protein [Chloroflexota bacterium]MBP8058876.1 hypothetical protein [Chloroflexota bacterium]
MTKRSPFWLISLLFLLITACTTSTDEPTIIPATTDPLALPSPTTSAYPAPDIVNTVPAEAYPAAPTTAIVVPVEPTLNTAYPGETLWITRPLGQQCVDASTYTYPDLSTAVAALNDVGIPVLAMEEVALIVCQACDCPTSQHFRVQINTTDLTNAQALGWVAEN